MQAKRMEKAKPKWHCQENYFEPICDKQSKGKCGSKIINPIM